MRAAEHAAHAGSQILTDPVAGQPRAGTGPPRGPLVGRVGFRADDDDALAIEAAERVPAAPREVSGVNDDNIRLFCGNRHGEIGLVSDGAELPAGLVALQQFDDQAPQRWVGRHHDN